MAPSSPAGEEPRTSAQGDASVEYFVRAGEVPDELESVTVTARIVLVDRPDDLGPCYPDVFTGPYKPTVTPIGTPGGDCHRSAPVDVDLTTVDGTRSLGTGTAPGPAGGHALVVTDVTATHENGTSVTAIRGAGVAELVASPTRPSGQSVVEIGLEPAPDGTEYDYWLVAERVERSG